ncbi:hypothetical protein [Acinetobacter sp. c3-l95]|uniref:hypothetical protein n=1 Tax=Acinetobacter sp. c3-l95 TaxID=3342804 RepID=UPI0035B6C4FF
MNIVLVGFSEKDAHAISILSYMISKEITSHHLNLADETNPWNIFESTNFDTAILFVDSLQHNQEWKRNVAHYISEKPVLLVSRYLEDLQQDMWGNMDARSYIQYPYTLQMMSEPLTKLYTMYQEGTLSNGKSHFAQDLEFSSTDADHGSDINLPTHHNYQLIQQYYPALAQQSWCQYFFFSRQESIEFNIGPYQFIFNADEKSATCLRTLSWTLDYIRVGYDDNLRIEVFHKILESNQAFLTAEQMIAAGASKTSLAMTLWQLAFALSEKVTTPLDKTLSFKVFATPNLRELVQPEPHLHSIFSACLMQSRNLEQLSTLFPNISPELLQRIMLSAVVANIATFEEPKSNVEQVNRNKGIQQANKTGFLQRLLRKIGLN